MASPNHPIATELVSRSSALGFNLFGFVDGPHFDAGQPAGRRTRDFQPGCATVFLFGSGGPRCWQHLLERGVDMAAPAPDHHPIDSYCAAACEQLISWMQTQGIRAQAVHPNDDPALNFMQLAEMAGWGTISPVLGILLHPDYGPWVSIRAAVLIEDAPFGAVEAEEQLPFQPCLRCDQPCVRACPVGVYDGLGAARLEVCAQHRHEGHCGSGCDARRACPVGVVHRYGVDEEGFRHAYSLFAMRRHFGLE